MNKWVYKNKIVNANCALTDYAMNRYGEEGWELVTVCPSPCGKTILYVFKRPVEDQHVFKSKDHEAI